jgi:hypothetical protein
MTFARRLAHVDIIPQQDSAQNAFNQLARTRVAAYKATRANRLRAAMALEHRRDALELLS